MRIATWNVNGIRARNAQVIDWIARDRPDVVCLQEIKARPDQLPPMLFEPEGYWCHWHGAGGYSGVALFVSKDIAPLPPVFDHPPFDFETAWPPSSSTARWSRPSTCPTAARTTPAKMTFLEELAGVVGVAGQRAAQPLVLCGDLNVAHTDRDLHPKERKLGAIGQRPDERALFDRLLAGGLVDVGRSLNPGQRRACSRGGRRGGTCGSATSAGASTTSWPATPWPPRATRGDVLAEIGTSDHAPVVADFP